MIKTKIVCTLGPATDDPKVLEQLIKAGMNVARLNFSHSNHDEQKRRADMVKMLRKKLSTPVALMIDTKGPDIRVGKFKNNFAELFPGDQFTLSALPAECTKERAFVTYCDLPKKVKVGQRILLDDGLIALSVQSKTATDVVCRVEIGGIVANNKSVNIPGAALDIPFMRENDINDIKFAIENDFDIIAASFVRSKDDLKDLTDLLKKYNSKALVISKIENREGIDNIDEILSLSDGIMVARGDLGVEIDFEEIPSVQKYLIKKAHLAGKHCITATQMLESMIKNPRPTRAEITDVANSIYDGTGAIMLSGETAVGNHAVATVKTMVSIAKFTEQDIDYKARFNRFTYDKQYKNTPAAICLSSVAVAHNIGAKAIITVSMSGATTNTVSRFRPECNVLGFTSSEKIYNQLALTWGVTPMFKPIYDNDSNLFDDCIAIAKTTGFIEHGDMVVTTAGYPFAEMGQTNNMRVMRVE